jgi:glycosyltransferase involved in cell wall biosynthesis
MKVLSISSDKKIFEPNSATLERLKLYASLCEKMSVVVLTLKKFPIIKEGNLQVYATGSKFRLEYFFDALKIIKNIFKSERLDLVTTQDPFEMGFLGWSTKKRYKIPWQCQIHGDIFSPYFIQESIANKFRVLLAKFLLPRADGIRVVSQRIKDSLFVTFSKLKVDPIVLPIFVDVQEFKSADIKIDLKQKYSQFNFLILIASRLSQEKNIDLAISAMLEIVKKYPKAGLLIVGEGKEKKRLENLIKKLNLDLNVLFESWVLDLSSYYKTADLFLLTSNYEGWGMTVIEAAACGCPIVMTDVGCAGEFIKNEENGLIVKVNDKQALIQAMERIITDRNFGKKISEEAERSVLSLPNLEQYLDLYKKSFTGTSLKSKIESSHD